MAALSSRSWAGWVLRSLRRGFPSSSSPAFAGCASSRGSASPLASLPPPERSLSALPEMLLSASFRAISPNPRVQGGSPDPPPAALPGSRPRSPPHSPRSAFLPRPSFPLSFLKAPETRLGKAAQPHRPEPRPGLSWAPSVRGHRLAVSLGARVQPRPGQGWGALRPARVGRRAREKGENLSALTGSGGGCSKRLRLAVEAASGSALT